jgi:hypothetical protein
MICMPSSMANSGIQNLSVLPDLVADIKKISFSLFSKTWAILIHHRQGVCPKIWIVFWRRLMSVEGTPGELCDSIRICRVIAFLKCTMFGLSKGVATFVYQCFPQAAGEGLGKIRVRSLKLFHSE